MSSKAVSVVTFSRGITPQNQLEIFSELKSKYLDNGWDLFSTHFAGIVGPELNMVYTLVYREPELVPQQALIVETPAKRRGRPPKARVEEVAEALTEGAGAIPS